MNEKICNCEGFEYPYNDLRTKTAYDKLLANVGNVPIERIEELLEIYVDKSSNSYLNIKKIWMTGDVVSDTTFFHILRDDGSKIKYKGIETK